MGDLFHLAEHATQLAPVGDPFGVAGGPVDFLRRKAHVISQAQRGILAAELKTAASTRTVPADDWVLNEISAHIAKFDTGPDGVIITHRVGKVAQRNSFGHCWRNAVADARTCGKAPANPQPDGKCGEDVRRPRALPAEGHQVP